MSHTYNCTLRSMNNGNTTDSVSCEKRFLTFNCELASRTLVSKLLKHLVKTFFFPISKNISVKSHLTQWDSLQCSSQWRKESVRFRRNTQTCPMNTSQGAWSKFIGEHREANHNTWTERLRERSGDSLQTDHGHLVSTNKTCQERFARKSLSSQSVS